MSIPQPSFACTVRGSIPFQWENSISSSPPPPLIDTQQNLVTVTAPTEAEIARYDKPLRQTPHRVDANELIVFRSSDKGWCIKTRTDISAGSIVSEYIGEIISDRIADVRGGEYLFAVSGTAVIDGRRIGNTSRFISHSCRPNLSVHLNVTAGPFAVVFVADADIVADSELTFDYNADPPHNPWMFKTCKCDHCKQSSGGIGKSTGDADFNQ